MFERNVLYDIAINLQSDHSRILHCELTCCDSRAFPLGPAGELVQCLRSDWRKGDFLPAHPQTPLA